jgi:SAM-dependent methyltransferase
MTDSIPLADFDPTGRFTDRAGDYAKYRPDYPAAAITAVLAGLGDPSRLEAADVGAGTGISSRLLAARGVRVMAVEPNRAMRDAAAPDPRVTWRDGTGEATGLDDGSVDLVVVAQAFHWFRQHEAVREFHRILRPHGRLAVMWNSRDSRDPLTRGFIEAIHDVQGEHPAERREIDAGVLESAGGFEPPELLTFDHHQDLDREAFLGRATSASYVPKQGEGAARLMEALASLHARHLDAHGLVRMRYVTKVYRTTRRDS